MTLSGDRWEPGGEMGRDSEILKGGSGNARFGRKTSNSNFLPILSGAGPVRWPQFKSLVSRSFIILGTNGPIGHH